MRSILGLRDFDVRRLWQARNIQKTNKGDPLETIRGPESIATTSPSDLNLKDFEERFPGIVQDGVLDAARLGEILGIDVSAGKYAKERYGFLWAGKQEAIQALMTPSFATLKPDLQNSINWDTAENVFIEGDNLEVLKLLQNAYNDQVKLIYIDPPYNTGNDFVYKDDFSDPIKHYLEVTGQVDAEGNKLVANTETSGRKHSNWLTMMYPRLTLARNLLRQEGAIFISIDDNEVHNLKILMNDIFGPENFIGQFVWAAGRKNNSKFVSTSHEYVLVYSRNIQSLVAEVGEWRQSKEGLDEIYKAHKRLSKEYGEDFSGATAGLREWYRSLPDSDPAKRHKHYSVIDARGVYFPADISAPGGNGSRYEVMNPKTGKPATVPSRGWAFSEASMVALLEQGLVHFGDTEASVPCVKKYLHESEHEVPYSVFYNDGRGATKRLRNLLGGDFFDFPKDEFILQKIVEIATENDDLVLDFFAGSGTIGHAVELQNKADGGGRRYICVTWPEPTPEKSAAHKAGLLTVSQITRLRLGKVAELFDGSKLRGLRCFSVSKSNFRVDVEPTSATPKLFSETLEVQPDPKDIETQISLIQGVRLDLPRTSIDCAGVPAVQIQNTLLVTGLTLTEAAVEAAFATDASTIIFLEDGFAGKDSLKANAYFYAKSRNIIMRTF
jgi:adenine-specific DNA-methyltransferase